MAKATAVLILPGILRRWRARPATKNFALFANTRSVNTSKEPLPSCLIKKSDDLVIFSSCLALMT